MHLITPNYCFEKNSNFSEYLMKVFLFFTNYKNYFLLDEEKIFYQVSICEILHTIYI